MWRVNPEFRSMFNNRIRYAFAVLGFFAFVVALATLSGCTEYARANAAEPPACRDETLAVITAACVAEIKATPNVTEKNRLRAACIERVIAWEKCE